MNAISLKDVAFSYPGGKDMRFDFSVAVGERLAIMGASGSGKSTLLHVLAGFETPLTGSIAFTGVDMMSSEPAARPVSILFQDNNLFGHLTVAQNTGLGIAPRLTLSKTENEAVEQALSNVGLNGFGRRLPSELSGGERQRAALARCLLRNKPILLLDEPFAALGPALKADMLALVDDVVAETGATLLMVTHDPNDARGHSDLVVFVDDGVAHAPIATADLFANPPAALRAYLGQ